jgi:hypothetical protein
MRDNHEELPELIKAYECNGHYFGEISVTINDETCSYEIGLTLDAYHSFKRMTSLRPFDTTPGLKHRYFFVPSLGGTPGARKRVTPIRVEQGRSSKQIEVEASIDLIVNLIWFFDLKNFSKAAHLKEIKKPQS